MEAVARFARVRAMADNEALRMSNCLIACGFVAAVLLTGLNTPVQASLPVPYAIVGCVAKGVFRSQGFADRNLSHPASKAIEGKTVRVEGRLSPGDRFRATAVYIVDARCRPELHKRYFLCQPCRTLPGMPETMAPRQPGTEVRLPPAAIDEFDNLSRGR